MWRALLVLALAIAFAPLRAATFGAAAAYSHLHPKHIALECRACHSLDPAKADLREMPGHAACSACHNLAADAVNRPESFCGECHTSAEASKDHPALFEFPKQHIVRDFGGLFSHVGHRNAGTATCCESPGTAAVSQCADCHAAIQPAAGHQTNTAREPDKKKEASHTSCFACHCENPRGYTEARKNLNPSRNDCAVCHVAQQAPLAKFADVRGFAHADHVFDTRPRRKDAGPVSRDPDVLCVECHRTAAESQSLSDIRQPAASTCRSCHTGKAGLPDTLSADALTPLETRP